MRRYQRRRRRDAQGLWVPVTRYNLTLAARPFPPKPLWPLYRPPTTTRLYTLLYSDLQAVDVFSSRKDKYGLAHTPTQTYALTRARPHSHRSCSSSVVVVVAPLFSSLGRHGKNMFHGRTYDNNNSSNHFPLFRQPQQILNSIPPPPPTRHP